MPSSTPHPETPEEPTRTPIPPPDIPDYELLRIIGCGSYGEVWLGRSITGTYRAVKVVWRHRFADAEPYEREFRGIERFAEVSLREAHQLALLHVGRNPSAGFFYYVMELADDVESRTDVDPDRYQPHTLKAARACRGRIPASQVLVLGTELARALSRLHARGLVHRDIKSSNVIFVGGVPKLADVGLVSIATTTDEHVGTEGFVPPEGPGTPAADVYSMGKLLYELSTGLDRQHYPRLPPNLASVSDRRLLLELNEILIRACDPSSQRRHTDAFELLDDLLALQAREAERQRGRARGISKNLIRAAVAVAGLAILMSVSGQWAQARAAREQRRRAQVAAEREALVQRAEYAAALGRAERARGDGDFALARRELSRLIPAPGTVDHRGFEWALLQAEAQDDPSLVIAGSASLPIRIAFTSDSRRLVHLGTKSSAIAWSEIGPRPFWRPSDLQESAGVSADGRWVVGVNRDGHLHRWSLPDAEREAGGSTGTYRPIAVLAAGERALALADASPESGREALVVWDFVQNTEVLRTPVSGADEEIRWQLFRTAMSTNGHFCLLALSAQNAVYQWKLQLHAIDSQQVLLEMRTGRRPTALAVSADGLWCAMAFSDSDQVQVWSLREASLAWQQMIGSGGTEGLSFSPDGRLLAAVGRDREVHLLNSATGAPVAELHGHKASLWDVAWSPDGSKLASIGASETRIWLEPARASRRVFVPDIPGNAITGTFALSGNGQRAASNAGRGRVLVLNTTPLAPAGSVPGLMVLGFGPEDRELITVNYHGVLEFWSPTHAATRPPFDLAGDRPWGMPAGLSEDKRWLVTSNSAGRSRAWDLQGPKMLSELPTEGARMTAVAISPGGLRAVSMDGSRKNRLWDPRSGRVLTEWRGITAGRSAAFSPDNRWLALGLGNGSIELREKDARKPFRTLRTSSTAITALTFSPDARRLVCGSSEGLLHVFATDDWREILTLSVVDQRAAPVPVQRVVLSADGRVLATFLADGRARFWGR